MNYLHIQADTPWDNLHIPALSRERDWSILDSAGLYIVIMCSLALDLSFNCLPETLARHIRCFVWSLGLTDALNFVQSMAALRPKWPYDSQFENRASTAYQNS